MCLPAILQERPGSLGWLIVGSTKRTGETMRGSPYRDVQFKKQTCTAVYLANLVPSEKN